MCKTSQACFAHQLHGYWEVMAVMYMQDHIIGMVAGTVCIAYIYFGVYWWYTTVAWKSLRTESYTKNK